MTHRFRNVVMLVLLAGAVSSIGCSRLDFIKRRLPPPHKVEGGYLFQFEAPSARVVQLAGNWPENNWLRGQGETARFDLGRMSDDDGDGIWEMVVDLPSGRYQYKFRIDETNVWKEDPNNPQRTDDGFGGFNSLLVVD